MTTNETLMLAVKNIALLELKNNASNDQGYREGLLDSIKELKKLMTDE